MKIIKITKLNKKTLIILAILLGLMLVVGGTFIIRKYIDDQRPIPSKIQRQLSFVAHTPTSKETFVYDRSTLSYNQDKKVLGYDVKAYENKLSVSQQPIPDLYVDDDYFKLQMKLLQQYAEFDSGFGTVKLTRPKTLREKQLAVAKNKTTLMFVQPEKDLTEEQWHQFFESLKEVKK